MNLTDRFLDSILKLADAPLSPGSVRQVERCILDYICVTFAGRKMLGDRLAAIEQGAPEGNCEVLGTDKKLSVYPAAFLNGFAAHFAELDDGNRTGAPHLEAVIISAMLAVAQSTEISFERFIKGIIVGYEATTRLSSAMQPGHKQKGFHATGTCGTIGVALAAGYALGYTRTQLKSTLSAAAAAWGVALGIGIQNFPEGAIISMPLFAEGKSKPKSFALGVLSGAVEPVFGALTVLVASLVVPAMPYFLSFAAGAMLYVVVEELIPEMSAGEHSNIGVIAFAVGFSIMMALDVALG